MEIINKANMKILWKNILGLGLELEQTVTTAVMVYPVTRLERGQLACELCSPRAFADYPRTAKDFQNINSQTTKS